MSERTLRNYMERTFRLPVSQEVSAGVSEDFILQVPISLGRIGNWEINQAIAHHFRSQGYRVTKSETTPGGFVAEKPGQTVTVYYSNGGNQIMVTVTPLQGFRP